MKAEIKKLITDLNAKGKSYSTIRNVLLGMDHAKNAKEADKLLAEAKIEKGRKIGIIDAMYDFLIQEKRSELDLKTWIDQNGTENTIRWIKSHDKARVAINAAVAKHTK